MAAIEVPEHHTQTVRFHRASVSASLVAAALFLGSAALQLTASLQRWVVFRDSRASDDISVEDHLFDYSFPWDPWEPIGTAAELYGAGSLLMALGVLAIPLAMSTMERAGTHRGVVVVKSVLALLVAGSLGLQGAHALISGMTGEPSPLAALWAVGAVGVVGLIALAVLGKPSSRAVMVACVFLIGNTLLGQMMATYLIAPLIAGGSHDTAPWSETVVAASTAAAGVAMIVAGGATLRRRKLPSRGRLPR